jgi:APA family basic amino acid/polyamine antiporter
MEQQPKLIKGLGVYGATSVVVGTMIGTSIFLVPSIMLRHVGQPSVVVVIWIVAGFLSLFGALGYAELGAAIPETGGEYVYLRRAYNPMTGFVYGWTQFVVAKSASVATIATAFMLYLTYFFPRLGEVIWTAQPHIGDASLTLKITGLQLGATVMVLLVSGLNVLGVRRSGAVQTIFTASKLGVLAALIVLGLLLGHGSFTHLLQSVEPEKHGSFLAAAGVAMVSALWAYDGWNNLSMVSGEVENPQRNMPRALILGTMLVGVVYVLANLAYFYVLTPASAAHTHTVAADAAGSFLGRTGGTLVAIGVLISTFATLNGSTLAGSRIPYALACDGLFPKAIARVNARFHTPEASIWAQACIAGLFALTGQYEALFTKVIFSEFLFYALITVGIILLRRREPNLTRPYKTWGYPVVPIAFVILSVLFLTNTFLERRADSLWGLALMGSGIPAYYVWKLWTRKETRKHDYSLTQ